MRRLLTALVVFALLAHASASAQPADPTIATAVVTNDRQMTVVFSEPVTGTAGAPHLDPPRVRLLPDNVAPVSIARNPLATDTLTLTFSAVPETAARVCFDQVAVAGEGTPRTSSAQVCADLSRDPASLKAAWIAEFQKVPRRSADKDIFASGFVTAAPDESAGGADISLNPRLAIPNLRTFLVIKKATAADGDPRHFEAGARYRYARPWKPGEIEAMAAETDPARLNELIRRRQRNILAGWTVDLAGRLEADPTDFDVTNAVAESSLLLQTMTRGFPMRRGFWRAFVLPVGVEVGQSLGTTVPEGSADAQEPPPPSVNRIARVKAGAGLSIFFDNPGAQRSLRRLELEISGVLRHLFLDESRFDEAAGMTGTTDDGMHGYAQIDLKVFVAETPRGRFGVRASYNRGRLPPVYADVRSVNFGFVIESGDDNGKATGGQAP